ncbi:MAG: hypothetical protein JWN73_3774 [Betaproteobacteria bacterium]|nr:hypothetical protein [Betaproteobacteria bacterium]
MRLFRVSRGWSTFAALAFLVAVSLLWAWAAWLAPRLGLGAGLLAASMIAGIAALYYGLRVGLDAELFTLLGGAEPANEADFAAGIDAFRACLRSDRVAQTVLGPRYAGALRLWASLGDCPGLAGGAACGGHRGGLSGYA